MQSNNNKASNIMLNKSKQKLESAKDDYKKERYDSCVSNLYYASFQLLIAYSIINNLNFHKHTHARSFLNKELVKKNIMPQKIAQPYNKLLDYRQKADYNYEFIFDKELTSNLLQNTEIFSDFMKDLVNKELKK